MGKDFLGKRLDATLDALVKFLFEVFPYILMMIGVIYFLYKLFAPAIIITYD